MNLSYNKCNCERKQNLIQPSKTNSLQQNLDIVQHITTFKCTITTVLTTKANRTRIELKNLQLVKSNRLANQNGKTLFHDALVCAMLMKLIGQKMKDLKANERLLLLCRCQFQIAPQQLNNSIYLLYYHV